MHISRENCTLSPGYVCVVEVPNGYIAVHVQENEKTHISTRPETDRKMAILTAKTFAQAKHLPYCYTPTMEHPHMTIVKRASKWYPAEVQSGHLEIFKKWGSKNLGGSFEEAVDMAQALSGVLQFIRQTESLISSI